ncbi:MAG TPA: 6-phosphogluconolactonase [Dietzia timorensis]|uniref:6-phosphogluconolactonase n=1 Tax=Dietzia timorensis TaxID=499555 RepID=A0A921JZC5_9ACTN|nr:6-phosphogluconolactonase [Dietzia timorensis]HJE92210.1 6-phosphogluconolactonase [Dietzia timorensis]
MSRFDPAYFPDPETFIHSDVDELAAAAANAIAEVLAETRETQGRPARISLTGGGAGLRTARRLAAADIDWTGVEVHFGDERFVPRSDPERNSAQVREALLDRVSGYTLVDWPAPGDDGAANVDEAAASFAAAHPLPSGDSPTFDLFLLGMGGEGHVNSVFPHSPQVASDAADVMAVHDCPKPPPERMTYSLDVVRRSAHVFFLVAGSEKAEAAAAALDGADPKQWPAAGARGTSSTRWFLDEAAAAEIGR